MFITLFAVICLAGADPESEPKKCVHEIVADQYMAEDLTMGACLGASGQNSAKKFVEEHPLYSDTSKWKFAGWQCQMGNKPRPKSNEA